MPYINLTDEEIQRIKDLIEDAVVRTDTDCTILRALKDHIDPGEMEYYGCSC
jgi:hypothetical protein